MRARSEQRTRLVSLDGRVLPAARARLSVDERGFLYGDAVFETARVAGGVVPFWAAHERRLRASLRRFRISLPRFSLARAVADLVAAARVVDGAVRVTVSRGAGEGLLPPHGIAPTVLVTTRPLPPDLEARRNAGIAVRRLAFGRGRGALGGHKTAAYLPAVLGRMEAARAGGDDGLYVEADGTVSEATTSNLFAVQRGALVTPPLDGACLAGVTRAAVLRLARRAGLRVREAPLRAADLPRCEEIFLTNAIQGLVPVVRLDGAPIGDGTPGRVTRLLERRFAEALARAVDRAGGAPRTAPRGRGGGRVHPPSGPRRSRLARAENPC